VIAGFLLGNNPVTTLRHYTHLIDAPEVLPITIAKEV
jgi:hypothetical protein